MAIEVQALGDLDLAEVSAPVNNCNDPLLCQKATAGDHLIYAFWH